MTFRAIAGLATLNVFIFVVGAGVLWGIRGWLRWGELVRLAGVAYLLGIASLTAVLTCGLVLGLAFGPLALIASGSAIIAAGLLLGKIAARRLPRPLPSGWRPPVLALPTALVLGVLALYFEALFRAARLAPPGEWDAWWVWTIRAKALYHAGDLGGEELVRGSLSDYPSYPPGLSLLHASGFEAMGTVDAVTLHLQHWFLAIGFALALLGLLWGRVRPAMMLPFIVICLTMPMFVTWAVVLYADLLLAFLVAVAALLLCLWLEDRERWHLVAAAVLLGGALLTKREGIVVVGCVLVACAIASWRDRTWSWPRLMGVGLGAVAMSAPWWFGYTRGLEDAAPSSGFFALFEYPERIWPSLRLVVSVYLDIGFSLGLAIFALISAVLAFVAGVRRPAVFGMAFLVLSVVGTTVVIASEPLFEFSRQQGANPVDRLALVSFAVLTPLIPLLLGQAWARVEALETERETAEALPRVRTGPRLAVPWVVASVIAVGYPTSMVVGYSGFSLPGGAPVFPGSPRLVPPKAERSSSGPAGLVRLEAEVSKGGSRADEVPLGARTDGERRGASSRSEPTP